MRLSPSEIFISIDIECDGPCPGVNSMLQLGAVAFNHAGREVGLWDANILPIPGAVESPGTMKWWLGDPARKEKYAGLMKHRVTAIEAMKAFDDWCKQYRERHQIVAVAYPAGFDFSWLYYYSMRFLGNCPFSFHRIIDIKNIAWVLLDSNFHDTVKKNFPEEWGRGTGKHTHDAVDDAREQGRLFFNMVRWYQRKRDVNVDDHK